MVEGGATKFTFSIFDFGEVDFVVLDGDNVDFVEFGFVVASDDSMANTRKVICRDRFTARTEGR